MSLDTIGTRAARVAHDVARTADPDAALGTVLRRSRRRDRIQRVAGAAAIVALLAGIGGAVPLLAGDEDDPPTLSDLSGTHLRIPIEADLPDGFRLVQNRTWALVLDARDDLTPEQPWIGFTIDRPDGVIDPETQEVLPLPDDLADWVRTDPTADVLAERTVEVAGRQAFQWDIQPKAIQGGACYTVDGQPQQCGNSLHRFRVTLLEVDGMSVLVSGGVPKPFWPLPEPGTPGDPYDALIGSIRPR